MTSPRTGPPPSHESQPPPSDGRSSDAGVQRVTLPAITPPDSALSQRPNVVRLASGRTIVVTEGGGEERLEVRSSSGDLVIAVRLTDAGPVFSMSGAAIEIAAATKLSLRGDTVQIAARRDLTIEAGGALYQRAASGALREIGGLDRTTAGEIEVEVHPGGISLRANDDVDIVGERVRLNSDDPPMPRSWEEHRARHALPDEGSGSPFSAAVLSPPPAASAPPQSLTDDEISSDFP